jgi:tripartite-type tricarboxylate transporter receptor subunit TctC
MKPDTVFRAPALRLLALRPLLLAALAAPLCALAQAYPAKPIKTIMTIGGGADLVARIVAAGLQEPLGQPVIVEVQSGAGGSIGQEAAARAAPDGYTLMFSSVSSHVTPMFLSKNVRFDPIKSYTPIAKVAESILLVAANAQAPYSTVAEMVEYAKRNPGKISYGTSGVGTTHHFAAVMITAQSGIDWVHVPYKAGPPVVADMVSGQIQVGFVILGTLGAFAKSGKVKIIGTNMTQRVAQYPNLPTVTEQLPGYEPPPTWLSYFGPAGLPQPIVQRLYPEIMKIMALPETKAKLEGAGFVISTGNADDVVKMIQRDIAFVGRAVKTAGIQPE